jgi:hypothetical protein
MLLRVYFLSKKIIILSMKTKQTKENKMTTQNKPELKMTFSYTFYEGLEEYVNEGNYENFDATELTNQLDYDILDKSVSEKGVQV